MLVPHAFDRKMIGAYKVERTLKHDRLRTVYLAFHPVQLQNVVVTVFAISQQLSDQDRSRFLSHVTREISIQTTLHHPSILPVIDYGEQDGNPFMVTSTSTATPLSSLLQQKKTWSLNAVLSLLKQINAALDFAHQRGIVHGILQPEYLLLDEDGTVLITSFGIGRLLERNSIDNNEYMWGHLLSVAGTFSGALEYIAPECVQGEPADKRSDIYSLGCILFAILSGAPPFAGTPLDILAQQIQAPVPALKSLPPDLSERLDIVLQTALAYDPARRLATAGALTRAFEQVIMPYSDTLVPVFDCIDSSELNTSPSNFIHTTEEIIVDASPALFFEQAIGFNDAEQTDAK